MTLRSALGLLVLSFPQLLEAQSPPYTATMIVKDDSGKSITFIRQPVTKNAQGNSVTTYVSASSPVRVYVYEYATDNRLGCSVQWGQEKINDWKYFIPDGGMQRCNHGVAPTFGPTKGATYRDHDPAPDGVWVRAECNGGHIFDRYPSEVKLRLTIAAVPIRTPGGCAAAKSSAPETTK